MTDVLRMAAFTTDPAGGNPAGVVLDAGAMSADEMLAIAAEVGYAETAFVVRPPTADDPSTLGVRYFSPTAEVPFCGHATIATAVVLAGQSGLDAPSFRFDTPVGPIVIATGVDDEGRTVATFTSVDTSIAAIEPAVLDRLLSLLRVGGRTVSLADIHPAYPPMLSSAGNTHPVVVLSSVDVFDSFTFDGPDVRALMDEQGWAGTVTILSPRGAAAADGFEARNLFPVGTMDEDPATGSAAASVGAYLRALGLVTVPSRILVLQGRHVGRPGLLTVDIPVNGGVSVTGTAVPIGTL